MMEPGAIAGYGALILSAIGTIFAYISNKDKNKNDSANVVIGGYDKLAEDQRLELDRVIAARDKAEAQRDALIEQNSQLTRQNSELLTANSELQSLGSDLQRQILALTEQIEALTRRIMELQQQLENRSETK